ncbi:alpha-tubulin N-acetyltransferase 1 isoform X3 [Drosophila miranda]|uniref:alpha-tubulin N-acetyltransferase 1 isoform X3 n=1 Tax=Drosophila miranda TaxID=7229 RepID=UPI00143F2454|nr:alpha-tubulin N-acetyltransferase 1 isoform X3 [Drosophila miranda]
MYNKYQQPKTLPALVAPPQGHSHSHDHPNIQKIIPHYRNRHTNKQIPDNCDHNIHIYFLTFNDIYIYLCGGNADGNNIAEEMTAQMDLHHLEDQQQAHGHMNTKRMDLQEVADQEEAHFIRYGLPPQMDSQPEFEPEPEPLTPPSPPEVAESIIGENRRPAGFHLSKQHTGMKNRSSGVGMAVMPTSKMEFNQEEREDFGVVKINRPPGHNGHPLGHDNTDAVSTVSSGNGGHLTNEGYNDLKFYHNRLW